MSSLKLASPKAELGRNPEIGRLNATLNQMRVIKMICERHHVWKAHIFLHLPELPSSTQGPIKGPFQACQHKAQHIACYATSHLRNT